MKIFATFIPGARRYPELFRIGLNPDAFPKRKFEGIYGNESEIYFQEIDPEIETTSFLEDDWMPYNGEFRESHGYIIDGEYVNEDDDIFDKKRESLSDDDYWEWRDNLPIASKYLIYKDGEIVDTLINIGEE